MISAEAQRRLAHVRMRARKDKGVRTEPPLTEKEWAELRGAAKIQEAREEAMTKRITEYVHNVVALGNGTDRAFEKLMTQRKAIYKTEFSRDWEGRKDRQDRIEKAVGGYGPWTEKVAMGSHKIMDYNCVKRESAKAFLVELTEGETIWLPKSRIDLNAAEGTFLIETWLARKHGWVK